MKKAIVAGVFAVIVVGFGGMAFALDVIGITMANIAAGYFTPGDSPGFPLTISKAGSYKLMENITVQSANTTAIQVMADNVTIDLNGFSIIGPVVCSGYNLVCVTPGTGNGIDAAYRDNLKVINGTIKGMGKYGILNGHSAIIEGVNVVSNGDTGIQLGGATASIRNCTAYNNGGNGLTAYRGNVSGSVASGNGLTGISVVYGILSGNTALANGTDGIRLGQSGTVSGNFAGSNKGDGLSIYLGGAVNGNSASGNLGNGIWVADGAVNGNSADNNVKNGIEVAFGTVIGNTSVNNQGYGLSMGTDVGYVNNHLGDDNDDGFVNGGLSLGNNICGNALCP